MNSIEVKQIFQQKDLQITSKNFIFILMKPLIDFVNALYAQRRWRVTSGVKNLVLVLEENDKKILTPSEICDGLEARKRPMDLTTVYRILERLEELHLVHQINGSFIRCSHPENKNEDHHFLIDKKTKKAEEIFLDYRSSIAVQLKQEKSFDLNEVSLVFYGDFK